MAVLLERAELLAARFQFDPEDDAPGEEAQAVGVARELRVIVLQRAAAELFHTLDEVVLNGLLADLGIVEYLCDAVHMLSVLSSVMIRS